MTKRIGIFPGSFDPITYGHLDLIERSTQLFDEVIVLVAMNTSKSHLFSPQERIQLVKQAVSKFDKVRVEQLRDELVAEYYQEVQAVALIRGLRNTIDFEYEYNIHSLNQGQYQDLETVLLYAKEPYRAISSSMIKEIAQFNGDVSSYVPMEVERAMKDKWNNQ
ncbi:pantetheine-phosphate adenylyltransferase [Dolosicoccus paucivorans]|uniref:pantetheine-phosphate adenylyltransferase n=1 Tax=Dolosicoccus paucivorans TaxID=84521 RepID=UPI00088E602D|nr:pantetheine-phosphate adenylyltransferase [Dolosicoccus paucivorans]SDI42637.1 Phosphopantetheine adenylyltransferase [Dolosicoccus paucivorans]